MITKKRTYIVLMTCLCFSLNSLGQDFKPTREVEITDDGIIVTYRFQGGFFQEDPLHEGSYFWKIPGFALNDVAGEPAFPFHWDTFAMPDDVEVNVEVIDSAYTDTLFSLAPAYPPLLMNDTIGYTPERVLEITAYSGLYPRSAAVKGSIQSYRGQGLVKVATLPVQYNYQTQTVRSFSIIKYMVSFINNGMEVKGKNYVSSSSSKKISITDHFLENTTLNYVQSNNSRKKNQLNPNVTNATETYLDNRDYLIVYPSKYEKACSKLETWKRIKGFHTHTLCSDGLDVSDIKNEIKQLYNLTSTNLYYVLFIGGKSDVPTYKVTSSLTPSHLSDFYYGYMGDEELPNKSQIVLPSIQRGRLLVSTPEEAEVVIDKIISYESAPPTNPEFYKTALHCAYFQDDEAEDDKEDYSFVLTSEELKNSVEAHGITVNRVYYAYPSANPRFWNRNMVNGDSIVPLELQRPQFAWNGNTSDVINNINDGMLYVLYNTHGMSNTSFFLPEFNAYNVNNLSNSNLLPVLFSMACKSGKFDTTDCLSECFLQKEDGGCIAVYSPSEITYINYVDALMEGIFNAIWPHPGTYFYNNVDSIYAQTLFSLPCFNLGSILDFGTFYMANLQTPSKKENIYPSTNYMKEVHHLFGDPSMTFYTQQPLPVNNPNIEFNGDTISVTLNDGVARISFYNYDDADYMIDSFVGERIDYYCGFDSVYVCIDRPNYIPYVFKLVKDEFVQNEYINDVKVYKSDHIKVGRRVTLNRPEGDVIIENADLKLIGNSVELHPGTTIINSNVIIDFQ